MTYSPEDVAVMYETMTGEEIAALTGLALLKVYELAREGGADIRPRGHRPVLESPGLDVLQEMLANASQREVAEQLGVSKRTVQRWLGK